MYREVQHRATRFEGVVHAVERYPYAADLRTVQWTADMVVLWRRAGVRPPLRSLVGEACINWHSRQGAVRARRVIAQSPETARQMRTLWRTAPDDVVPIGVERSWLSPPTEVHTPPRVSLIGRLEPRKGQREFLRHLSPPGTNFDLTIIGGVSDDAYAREVLPAWEPYYEGYQSDASLRQSYGASDIVVVPSWLENFSMVGLEAIATSNALVITADCGMAQFDWATADNGIFVADDRRHAAALVSELVADPDLERYQQAAYELACSLTWDIVAQEYEAMYRDLA